MRSRYYRCGALCPPVRRRLASAQALSIEFHDGRVRLTAENVPVSRILAEWARVGGTRIVNGERVPGAPVTLQLATFRNGRRSTSCFGVRPVTWCWRATRRSPGASAFDKILVLPTTSRAPAAAALPQPAAQPPQFPNRPGPEREPVEIEEAGRESAGRRVPPPPAFPARANARR